MGRILSHKPVKLPKQQEELINLTVIVKEDFSGENVAVRLVNTHNARCAIRANNVRELWWLTYADYVFRGLPEEFPTAKILEYVRIHERLL